MDILNTLKLKPKIENQIKCTSCLSEDIKFLDPKYQCNKCGNRFVVLHWYQNLAVTSLKRFILVIAGIQGGKSEVGAKWITKEIIRYWKEDGDYLVAAPTYKTLSQSTLPKFLDEMKVMKLGKFSKQDMVFTLKNGKRVFLRSTEDPSTLEAMTLRSAWLDETGNMKKQVWINLQGRVGVLKGRIFMTTTPYPNYWWLVTEIIERWKQNDKDYEVIEFDSIANPAFPRDEYERAKRTLDSRVFAMRYQGKFVKMSGLVYPQFGPSNIRTFTDESRIVTWLGGIDWGHNFAFGLIGRDKDGTYWKAAEYSVQGGILVEHAKEIKKIIGHRNLFAIYADPSEPGLIQEMTILGLTPIIPANNDVELGINKVGELLNGRYYVDKGCVNTIDEYESYHRKEIKEGDGEAKIVKVKDHNVDLDRYILLSYPDEESIMPVEKKKDYEYSSELARRREEGLEKTREKFALRDRGVMVDSELGSDW